MKEKKGKKKEKKRNVIMMNVMVPASISLLISSFLLFILSNISSSISDNCIKSPWSTGDSNERIFLLG